MYIGWNNSDHYDLFPEFQGDELVIGLLNPHHFDVVSTTDSESSEAIKANKKRI